MIDALDEAITPREARLIVSKVVLPLVETCSDLGARVVLGTRPRDDDGDLLSCLGPARTTIDLDKATYFERNDLTAYALATLQLCGDERPDNPYSNRSLAEPVATRIAEISEPNFLVAGLISRVHGLHDQVAVSAADVRYSATVDEALRNYLTSIPPVEGAPAEDLLTVLASIEPPGLPLVLWRRLAHALAGHDISTESLDRFARGAAANFLVEAGNGTQDRPLRLYHQALNDALLVARKRAGHGKRDDERAIVQSLLLEARTTGWESADPYILRCLAVHADRAENIDVLLSDTEYLLHADLGRLVPLTVRAASPEGRSMSRLLHLTPRAIDASRQDRLAMFSVTEAIESLGTSFSKLKGGARYQAEWAATSSRAELRSLEEHAGAVNAVCSIEVDGQILLASAGDDSRVRLWDPTTGAMRAALQGHAGAVNAVCSIEVDGQILLASAGDDSTVRLWDPTTGAMRAACRATPAQ
ncbi:MAG: hypothetical protein IPG94_04835 [Kineosporiaceae bacterium]|nr:hypothetical protein [Kineosporiaceae bacterium]